jgi:tRNA pseudouridine38-40 synthase
MADEARLRAFLLRVAYEGGGFAGWQVQDGQRTVQGALQAAVREVAGEDVFVRGAGRTDAGVHARAQAASLRFATRIPAPKLPMALNRFLDDVAVVASEEVPLGLDAKRHSIGKRYAYRALTAGAPDVFRRRTHWQLKHDVDLDAMQAAAAHLVGEQDFESFRAAGCQAAHARRCLWRVDVSRDARAITIEVRGNAFCQHMVRIIAGTLIEVGRGRVAADAIPGILAARDRKAAGITAPAHGLTMEQVYFPSDAEDADIPDGWQWPGYPPRDDAWPPPDVAPA